MTGPDQQNVFPVSEFVCGYPRKKCVRSVSESAYFSVIKYNSSFACGRDHRQDFSPFPPISLSLARSTSLIWRLEHSNRREPSVSSFLCFLLVCRVVLRAVLPDEFLNFSVPTGIVCRAHLDDASKQPRKQECVETRSSPVFVSVRTDKNSREEAVLSRDTIVGIVSRSALSQAFRGYFLSPSHYFVFDFLVPPRPKRKCSGHYHSV